MESEPSRADKPCLQPKQFKSRRKLLPGLDVAAADSVQQRIDLVLTEYVVT